MTYTGNNRTHMIRIPDAGRFEFRLADGATNPYLLPAAVFAAGLDGMRNTRDPGKRLDINMYTDGHKVEGRKKLPLNMLDALRALEKSAVLKDALGEKTVASYIKLKTDDWNAYSPPPDRVGAPDDARLLSAWCAGMHYSGLTLAWNALSGHKNWRPAWRDAAPKASYDVIIIGGGGHGLATAHYLAKVHGITNVAVLEKSWIGSGNAGRNTTIIRSNYLLPGNERFYEWSMKLWEGLEQDLNYNTMVSQRGIINIYHSDAQRDAFARRGNSMRLHGADGELLDRERRRAAPALSGFRQCALPHPRRLDAARAAARRATTPWCGATPARRPTAASISCRIAKSPGSRVENGRAVGVETTRGVIRANKIGIVVAGNSSRLAAMAGFRLPIESHVLQAFVIEGIKPLVDHVITFGAGHFYISQSRQRRSGVRRRHRRLQLLCPARQSADGRRRLRRRHGADADDRTRCASCAPGAASWICRWTARRSSTTRRSTGSISMPAGATAASRRRRHRAGALRI